MADEYQKDELGRANKPSKKKKLQTGSTFLNWAEDVVNAIPTYYDRSGLWWVWEFDKTRYEISDETDILNNLRIASESGDVTVTKKNQLIEAIKQEARMKEPQPLGKEWVQFGRRLYNIHTGEETEASPSYFVTNPIPWEPGETEETPEMDRLFNEWVGEDYTPLLYEIIAYCTLPDYPLHRFFVLTGQGLNGKGKYLEVLEKFIGDENTTNIDLDALIDKTNRFEKSKLYKKLLCVVGETNYAEMKKTGELKQLTGGDLISFEYKNKNPFQARNYAKIVMATNSLPPTTDKTTGFYRRPLVIEFPNQFKENPRLLDRIPEQEYRNLARKCLRILKELLDKREFHREGSIEERRQKYEDVSNPLQKFLREKTIKDPSEHIFKWEFSDRLQEWMQENGYRVWSETMIGRKMKERFDDQKISAPNGKYWAAWIGLRWRTSVDNEKVRKTDNFQGFQSFQGTPINLSRMGVSIGRVETLETMTEDSQNTQPSIQEYDVSSGNVQWSPSLLLRFIRGCQKRTGDLVPIAEMEKLAGMKSELLDDLLDTLRRQGDVYEPKHGYVGVAE